MSLFPFLFYNKGKLMPEGRKRGKKMTSYVTRKTPGDTAWFTHDRFGMFIHFGLYAMPARHEWVKNHEEIPEDKYDLYFKHFNPDLCDPTDWARQAKSRRNEICGSDHQASRGLLSVRQ